MADLESGFRLTEVLALLRRRSAIMVAATVVGLVTGFVLFAQSPPNYSATSRVQVQPLSADPLAPTGPDSVRLDVGTERDLVKSDSVGDAVRAQLGLDGDNRELFTDLEVNATDDSLVLELTVESSSATRARDIANAVADAYLAERVRAAEEVRDESIARLDQQRTEARTALTEANQAVDASEPGSTARAEAQAAAQDVQQALTTLNGQRSAYVNLDTTGVGQVVRRAPTPDAVLSRMAVGKGVGVFGLMLVGGLGIALLVDRRDSLGGGRRTVEQLVPGANLRILPGAGGRRASLSETDAAIDRLAVDLASNGSSGRASSVLVVGTSLEPPIVLAEELASSLTYAGIPALFVLAGSSDRDVRRAHIVTSFTDLITGPSVSGPATLPAEAGVSTDLGAPIVTWLRPRGRVEASGLLRRAVIEALVTRAGREGFEAVVFVAAAPARNAAAAAIGQWVSKTALIVEDDDGQAVHDTTSVLVQSDVTITEVVWM